MGAGEGLIDYQDGGRGHPASRGKDKNASWMGHRADTAVWWSNVAESLFAEGAGVGKTQ